MRPAYDLTVPHEARAFLREESPNTQFVPAGNAVHEARELFPDAHARFQAAVQALPAEQAGPFAAALAELVALQARRFNSHGGFVPLPEWADVLDRHFPAAGQ
ncbi:hypothetical protein [Nonomuraea sp. CA-141351]|uniref:hypothetical protein n=1 Tax=Nonomuraea sp. CA-141351 TaxID=3239996 RepID=UPI003D8C800E